MRKVHLASLMAFLMTFLPFGNGQEVFKQSDGKECGIEGTAKSPEGKAIDRLKNKFDAPKDKEMDTSVSLAALLAPGDDVGRFDQSKGATIAGFVIDVKVGGVETCNCRAKAPIDRDTHIEIGFTKDADKRQKVIVEVTPRMRAKMKAMDVDWSTDALKKNLKGKWVKVTGWLLFDTPHMNEAENTHPGGSKNWRATCWEIHPITKIDVMAPPPADMPILHPDLLKAFHQVHARHFNSDPGRKDKILSRNKELVGRFPKEDLDDDLPIPGGVQEKSEAVPLQKQLASADLVVVGKVKSIQPEVKPAKPRPITLHDPKMHEAVIEIESIEKGKHSQKHIVVLFPTNDKDPMWRQAPKLKVGQEGVFIIHKDQLKPVIEGYTVLHSADYQPRAQLESVRKLIKSLP